MSQVNDLSAGDSTPKLAKASLMSITQVLNRMAYTIKTPDDAVAPDALQISTDGNMSLGDVPLAYSSFGRNFTVKDTTGVASIAASSVSGNALISVQTQNNAGGYSGLEFKATDGSVFSRLRYTPQQGCLKLDMKTGATTTAPIMRFNSTGEVVLGDTGSVIAKLMIIGGTLVNGGEAVFFAQSLDPANVPALITGTNGGSLQISGGNNALNSARGAQIDFNSGSFTGGSGHLVFRAGTNTGGAPSPEVGRWYPGGSLGINTGIEGAACMLHVRAPTGVRGRVIAESNADMAGFTARRTNGTYAVPTAIQNGDTLGFFNTHGSTGVSLNYAVGATIQMFATQNWSAGAAGSAMQLTTVPNGTTLSQLGLWLDHTGYAGFNTTTPASRVTVAFGTGLNGYEIQPLSTYVELLSRNLNSNLFTPVYNKANSHRWLVGNATVADAMLLETNGILAVGTTQASGGTGNTAIEGRIIAATQPLNAGLTIGDAGNGSNGIYSGLKIKLGSRHASSGGLDYFDITTRPGDSSNGVSNQSDIALIRLEASKSLTPRLLLQPSGGLQQVVVGAGTSNGSGKLVVEQETTYASPGITVIGKSGVTSSADIVISRNGAVSSTQGKMPWLQFDSTDAAFAGNNSAAIGAAGNSVEIWNYVSNVWIQKLTVGNGYLISNNSAVFNGKSEIAMHVRGPAATSSNLVLQANTSNGSAHWISSKTDGSIHFGAVGSSEPTIGTLAITPNNSATALYANNITQAGYTYDHGGTARILAVNNPDTSLNAQAHIVLSTGNVNTANSAIGGLSFTLPNISSNGAARVANIGASTDSLHESSSPAGMITMATKGIANSTATTRLVIRSSGNLTLGNTFTQDLARLYIYNEGRNVDGVRVDMSDAANNASSFVSMRNNTSGYSMTFVVSGNIAGSITHPSATTTAYGTSSDARIKENVKPSEDSGEIIDALEIVQYNMKADGYYIPFGFVAQKLHAVYPTAVIVGDTALDITPDSKIWGIDATKLVPVVAKEVQSLRKRVAKQDEDIAELRELVNLLLQEKGK